MPIDRDIPKLVRRQAALERARITSETLFTSREYREHIQALVDTTTGRYSVPVKVELCHEESSMTASTDGTRIRQNTNAEVIRHYESLLNRYMACIGMTMHECAHILFCDFESVRRDLDLLEHGLFCGEEPQPPTTEWAAALDEMKQAMQVKEYVPVFQEVYRQLWNCIADPHDEDKLMERFGGFVQNAILILRESLRSTVPTLESMLQQVGKQGGRTKLTVMFSVILQFARFGEIISEEPEKIYHLDPIKKLMEIAGNLDEAQYTDDPAVRSRHINMVMLYLWPLIKEEIEKLEQKQPSRQSEGSGGPLSQETVQQILEQIRSAASSSGTTTAPERSASSALAKELSKQADTKGTQRGAQPQKTEQAGQSALDGLLSAVANQRATELIQAERSMQRCVEISGVEQCTAHAGRPVIIVEASPPSQEDKERYDQLMSDLRLYSKRLQKQVNLALDDLKDGGTARHRLQGNRFDVSAAYRPDERFYMRKTMPQDLPGMAISILVDHSGSMDGPRLEMSMKAVILLHDFAVSLGIPVCVSGHNASNRDSGIRYYTYTDFGQVSSNEKYCLAQMVARYCNRDGMAIEITANRLVRQPEEVKLLIIISDGQPNHSGYGGVAAMEDIRRIVRRYEKRGVEIIAAAIGTDKDRIKAIYGDGSFLDIEDLESLPKTLARMVRKRILP